MLLQAWSEAAVNADMRVEIQNVRPEPAIRCGQMLLKTRS